MIFVRSSAPGKPQLLRSGQSTPPENKHPPRPLFDSDDLEVLYWATLKRCERNLITSERDESTQSKGEFAYSTPSLLPADLIPRKFCICFSSRRLL